MVNVRDQKTKVTNQLAVEFSSYILGTRHATKTLFYNMVVNIAIRIYSRFRKNIFARISYEPFKRWVLPDLIKKEFMHLLAHRGSSWSAARILVHSQREFFGIIVLKTERRGCHETQTVFGGANKTLLTPIWKECSGVGDLFSS